MINAFLDSIPFVKYHGLGNDYLVISPQALPGIVDPNLVRFMCDRHYGIGSDGILYGPLTADGVRFGLQIYNPDGSPAEKSGNGLRIFSRYLWDNGQVGSEPFDIETPAGMARCQVLADGAEVAVEIGRPSFDSAAIPVSGVRRDVVDETWVIAGHEVRLCALSLGNPHCVLLDQPVTPEHARELGPMVENEPHFPQRTNVQFLQVIDRNRLRIEIWERGAGYTLASGTSACAAASAAHRLGLCSTDLLVSMPGGELSVKIAADGVVHLRGPVTRVSRGELDLEGFENFPGLLTVTES